MTNGAVGGERGWAAAFFRFAVETAAVFEVGERMNMRKPMDSNAASTNVIGFVRLIDLAKAMLRTSVCGQVILEEL